MAAAPSGELVYANPAFEAILGVPPPKAARPGSYGQAFRIHTRDGAVYPEDQLPFARVLREKAPVVVNDVVVHRDDGKKIALRATAQPLFDPRGEVAHVVIAFVDISEESVALSRSAVLDGQLQYLLSHAPLVLFAFDREGNVTLSEGRGLESLGFRPKELVGRSVFDLFATDPTLLANVRRVLGGEDFTVMSPIGAAVHETTLTPTRNAVGEVDGAIGVSIDATDRANMQKRLLQAERLASMGTLSAAVAHEINNPLTYLLGSLDALSKRLADPEPASAQALATHVEQAREGAERVRRIVRGLQTFARQDEDRAEPTDVQAAIEHAIGMVDNVVRHRARLIRNLGRVPAVMANDLRLGQVLVNLLLNAAQAIPEGHADTNEIRIVSWHDEARGMVTVRIEDTGCGIAPETKERLFEPFFTTKPVGEGTGLGLPICYGILKGFGGRIQLDSVPGKGTAASVHLVACRRPRAGQPALPVVVAPLRRGRLLIVDDDPKVARMLAMLLSVAHDVEVCQDPRAAAERILGGERFDVIFCDLMMPDMTGMDFHAVLHARVPEQAERIVFITGGAFTPAARAFTSTVPNPFLDKPFDDNALHAVLASYLRR